MRKASARSWGSRFLCIFVPLCGNGQRLKGKGRGKREKVVPQSQDWVTCGTHRWWRGVVWAALTGLWGMGGLGDPARCAGLTWFAPSGRNTNAACCVIFSVPLRPRPANAGSARELSEFPISRDCGIALRTTRLSPFAFRPSAPLLRGSLPPASRAKGAGLAE
jgi:hypothetical protein